VSDAEEWAQIGRESIRGSSALADVAFQPTTMEVVDLFIEHCGRARLLFQPAIVDDRYDLPHTD
jgi:hypothetical protein